MWRVAFLVPPVAGAKWTAREAVPSVLLMREPTEKSAALAPVKVTGLDSARVRVPAPLLEMMNVSSTEVSPLVVVPKSVVSVEAGRELSWKGDVVKPLPATTRMGSVAIN